MLRRLESTVASGDYDIDFGTTGSGVIILDRIPMNPERSNRINRERFANRVTIYAESADLVSGLGNYLEIDAYPAIAATGSGYVADLPVAQMSVYENAVVTRMTIENLQDSYLEIRVSTNHNAGTVKLHRELYEG